jgi:predicted nucleotidyltransferase
MRDFWEQPDRNNEVLRSFRSKRKSLDELCRRYRVRRLDIFGSAAVTGEFDPRKSDLDFVVEFEPAQDLGPWLKHYFDFKEELERLFERKVDLVMSTALKNPLFVQEVNRTRALLYAA